MRVAAHASGAKKALALVRRELGEETDIGADSIEGLQFGARFATALNGENDYAAGTKA